MHFKGFFQKAPNYSWKPNTIYHLFSTFSIQISNLFTKAEKYVSNYTHRS